jgi:hypothetical protein
MADPQFIKPVPVVNNEQLSFPTVCILSQFKGEKFEQVKLWDDVIGEFMVIARPVYPIVKVPVPTSV